MDDSQALLSSAPLPYTSVIGNDEDASSLPVDAPHVDASSEEAWLDDDYDNNLELNNEWKLRRDKFYNDGYREGIIEGQKDAAQEGFNLGFKDSVMAGYNWGIVRGVTSGLAHLPDKLKEKLLEKEEVRRELLKLHSDVESMTTEDALKLFYHGITKEKSAEQSSSVDTGTSLTHQSDTGGLETYTGKFELLLKDSCEINVRSESIESAGSWRSKDE